MTGKVDELKAGDKVFKAPPIPSLLPCFKKKKKAPKADNAKAKKDD